MSRLEECKGTRVGDGGLNVPLIRKGVLILIFLIRWDT